MCFQNSGIITKFYLYFSSKCIWISFRFLTKSSQFIVGFKKNKTREKGLVSFFIKFLNIEMINNCPRGINSYLTFFCEDSRSGGGGGVKKWCWLCICIIVHLGKLTGESTCQRGNLFHHFHTFSSLSLIYSNLFHVLSQFTTTTQIYKGTISSAHNQFIISYT